MEQITKLAELERTGYLVIPLKGSSMEPLIREDSSTVLIRALQGRPRRNDVVLYVRTDGILVLHRIIATEGDICLIRGDNTYAIERVPLCAVRGVMETLWRGKKEIHVTDRTYRLYVWVWNQIYPLRRLLHRMYRVLHSPARCRRRRQA